MIGHDIAAALPELRAQAESMMITPCRISRTGTVTANPDTGADVIIPGAKVYAGGCKVQAREGQPQPAESGTATVIAQSLEVHVPASSGPYRKGDLVEILDRPDGAAAVVERRFRVEGLHRKTWQTAQRLQVEEL